MLEKVRGARTVEERRKAEQKIIEESIKRTRKVGEVAQRIAEMYGLAEFAWKMRDYKLAYKALRTANELREDFVRVCEEEREWSSAFWKIMRGEI